jgi:nucleotide-binding universal stress UspA family protein
MSKRIAVVFFENHMLRTVLVALDDSPYSETATTLAVEWAKRFGARLLGMGILDEPSITAGQAVPLGASAFKKELDEARLAEAQQLVLGFLSRFRERCSSAGVPADVVEEAGDPARCILKQAYRCDVIVLGYETHFHFETQDAPDTVRAKILRRSPRPIAVVPRELTGGSGVVVAYGGGREVTRTLQMFQLLGLSGGEPINLVSVCGEDGRIAVAAGYAAEFLEAHGESCMMHAVKSDRPAAEIILEHVEMLKPRLLIMGAHAHHPLRDLFATSVTRAVLQASPVPVLVGS